MSYIDNCRVCESSDLNLIIDFGMQPWCNGFLTHADLLEISLENPEPHYPLRVVMCKSCQTTQLDYTVPKEIMFADHTYMSGTTKSLQAHFDNVANQVHKKYYTPDLCNVLDIGSNDGTQLKSYKNLGWNVVGVESSKEQVKRANDADITTLQGFFNYDFARKNFQKHSLRVINAAGILFHLEELHSFLDGIKYCLAEDGVLIAQFLHLDQIMESLAFDQIYHEHLLYYSACTLDQLLDLHGLYITDIYKSDIHGGIMVAEIKNTTVNEPRSPEVLQQFKQEYDKRVNTFARQKQFAFDIADLKLRNLSLLKDIRCNDDSYIIGIGAPAKSCTLLHYFGLKDHIEYLLERNLLRDGMYSPGLHIPIIGEQPSLEQMPTHLYLLAWNFEEEIRERYKHTCFKDIPIINPLKV